MPANNRNVLIGRIRGLVLRDETACADDIEGCDTEETLGVVCAFGFEDFGANRDGTVDRICDDKNISVWGSIRDGFGEVPNDGGIGVEKVCERS